MLNHVTKEKACPAGNNAKEWWITILLRKIAVAESINGTDRTAARINNDRGDVRKTTCRTSTSLRQMRDMRSYCYATQQIISYANEESNWL